MSTYRLELIVVEDDDDAAELTLRLIAKSRPQTRVVRATTGEECLTLLEQGAAAGELPRLVLLDLRLPGMDGFDVLSTMRADERLRSIPVVILSSSVENGDIRHAYQAGANGYVDKSASYSKATEMMLPVCAFWLDVNRCVG